MRRERSWKAVNTTNRPGKGIAVQQYFGVANRKAEGLLLFKEKLDLSREFSYKTVERAYENTDVKELLEMLFSLTQDVIREVEKELAVEGTGLSKSMKRNYESDKRGGKKSKGYEKIVTSIGRRYTLLLLSSYGQPRGT